MHTLLRERLFGDTISDGSRTDLRTALIEKLTDVEAEVYDEFYLT